MLLSSSLWCVLSVRKVSQQPLWNRGGPWWLFPTSASDLVKMLLIGDHSHWSLQSTQLATYFWAFESSWLGPTSIKSCWCLSTWDCLYIVPGHSSYIRRASFPYNFNLLGVSFTPTEECGDVIWSGDGRFNSMGQCQIWCIHNVL